MKDSIDLVFWLIFMFLLLFSLGGYEVHWRYDGQWHAFKISFARATP